MAGGIVPRLDFSALGELPNDYRRAVMFQQQQEQLANRQRTLADLAAMGPNADYAQAGLRVAQADPELGMSLIRLADTRAMRDYERQKDARDFELRKQEIARAQANADRSFGFQEKQFEATQDATKVPAGFTRQPGGALTPVPGGPTDPAYVKELADAKEKPRQFNVGDVTKLSEEAGKFSNVAKFGETFQDRFAGYRVPLAGTAAMTAGRYLPEGIAGKDAAEGAAWWQQYDRYKNVIRNELFGSALTATEQSAFERADISPGMDPGQIKKNLAMQKQIAENGLKRKANALIQSGYDPNAISAAYGLDLKQLGVTATGKGKPQPSTPGVAPSGVQYDNPRISEAREAIARGADRAKVEQRLKQMRVDFNSADLDL